MKPYTNLRILCSSICALLISTAIVQSGDWPQWRGPERTGKTAETGWLVQWPKDGPDILWEADVGKGYSSASISNGRLYTMGNKDDVDYVLCLDAETGEQIWSHSYPCIAQPSSMGRPGTRCTPTIDGNRVYTLGREGEFFCFDAEDGTVIWSNEFADDFGAKPPRWGYSGSPLIKGDLIITEVGAPDPSVVAFNKMNGKIVWQAGEAPAAYSSPISITQDGVECVVMLTAEGLTGHKLSNGEVLWSYPWTTKYGVNAATPIVKNGKLFVSSGYGTGCALIDISTSPPKEIWQNRNMRNHVNSCVVKDGFIYGFDEDKLKCLDWETGEEIWDNGDYGKGSLILAGDKFLVYSDRARIAVAELSPDGVNELGGMDISDERDTWASPTLANGLLYCRAMNKLVCIDLRK
ncbi:MAG: PQQ-like beta-propeller repeat protein [Verrucomicrobia bacterium]|nr:PQQ-like beta-propeller repeat protein [Verrucomicrobiota bacterium]